jgi:hypothetical protein
VDAPDNLYAILAASKVLNKPEIALSFYIYGLKNFGFYNTSNPDHVRNKDGSLDWSFFQWRQFQMIFAALCASGIHKWWKIWHLPLALYTALVITVSCIGAQLDDYDARRLSWALIQATKEDSFLCRLASKIWYRRLHKDYPNGMRDIASGYYNPHGLTENPFAKYWIE